MKKNIFSIIIFTSLFTGIKAQVKIGNNTTSINSNSLLELESPNKGLLLPRLTKIQIKQMINAPTGMLVYNITDSTLSVRRDTGWVLLEPLQTTSSTKFAYSFALNGSNTFTLNHGLNTKDVIVSLYNTDTGRMIVYGSSTFPYLNIIDDNSFTFQVSTVPSTPGHFRIVVLK